MFFTGAQMVDFQMVSPGSEGLFRAAISQSAPCVFLRTLEEVSSSKEETNKMPIIIVVIGLQFQVLFRLIMTVEHLQRPWDATMRVNIWPA